MSAPIYMIFGKNGWIGGKLKAMLEEAGKTVVLANSRLENREDVAKELDEVKPTFVLNAAGVTGRPNVDWCESNREATIRANVIGTLNLADLCSSRGIHCTMYATGCIFEYDDEHPIGGKAFDEESKPNFDGSFYSLTKGMVEQMLKCYSNVMVLRVRMPLSDDLSARNFITKITKYAKVVDVPNSMTVLSDLLPVSIGMAEKKLEGVYNFTNPGAISHNQILDLYKKYIDPSFTYVNFSLEEQAKILAAGRSNNELTTDKIVAAMPEFEIPHIQDAIHGLFKRMRVNLANEGTLPAGGEEPVYPRPQQ